MDTKMSTAPDCRQGVFSVLLTGSLYIYSQHCKIGYIPQFGRGGGLRSQSALVRMPDLCWKASTIVVLSTGP